MTHDQPLLAEYARNQSEAAFQEIVANYVNLFFSSALRIVNGDRHRAEDVAQIVFVHLAQKAAQLPSNVMLGGWLHRHTCFVAANLLCGERRRRARERKAMEMNLLEEDSGTDLIRLGPLLDETIDRLEETDRAAIIARFFEQRDFRSIGDQLQSSEEAARKRVSRALEKLRDLLAQRGIRTTSAALSAVVVAACAQAAPAGLAAKISAALAGATAATTTMVTMTMIQKIAVAAALAVTIGGGIYAAKQAHHARAELQNLQAQQDSMAGQLQQLQANLGRATNRVTDLVAENARLKSQVDQTELLQLRGQNGVLKRQLAAALTAVRKSDGSGFMTTNQLQFAGYDTPAHAFESVTWAVVNGDFENWLNSFADSEQRQSPDEFTGARFRTDQSGFKSKVIEILARKTLDDARSELKVRLSDESTALTLVIPFGYANGEYKINGDFRSYHADWENDGTIQKFAN